MPTNGKTENTETTQEKELTADEVKKEDKEVATQEIIKEAKEIIEAQENEKNEKKDKKKIVEVVVLIIILLAVLIGIFSTIFALLNMTNTKMINGISINGIDISGLSKETAKEKITEELKKQLDKDINLTYKEYSTALNPTQIEFKYNIDDAIKEAYETGKNGNIVKNNYSILKTMINKKDVVVKYSYMNESLDSYLLDVESKLPDAITQYSYYIEDGKLIITPGKEGTIIQKDVLKEQIIKAIQSDKDEEKTLEIPVQLEQPNAIDIEKIRNEIYTEPKDAYYTKDPFVIYPEVYGVDFSISIDEAKQMIQTPQESYTIKLNYTKPNITKDQIGVEAFPDMLSSFSTKYDVTNRSRSNNLKLASDKINGTVLMPGEEFSYNTVVGERTIEAGYKNAKIYSNGEVVDGLGGGICQISSTLYNAVLYANLEVTSRRNHQFVTSYVKAGLDATVVYGNTDFKFKNSRKYPIKIVSEVKNGVAKIDIFGVKEEVEYEVRLDAVKINIIPFSTTYIKDSSLAPGAQVVRQKGTNGVKTVTYKYLILNGNVISKTKISTDTYNPMQKIIAVGE